MQDGRDWMKRETPSAARDSLHHYRFLVNENVKPSWFPYYYRAVATGEQDMVNGFIPGRSLQSNLVKVDRPPSTLPEIKDAKAVQSGSQAVSISFRSDAVLEVTPHGTFKLEIFAWDFAQKKFSDTPSPSVFLNKATPVQPPLFLNRKCISRMLILRGSEPSGNAGCHRVKISV